MNTQATVIDSGGGLTVRQSDRLAVVLGFAMTMAAITYAAAIPMIGTFEKELHTSAATAAWALIATSLAAGIATPLCGRLGDLFGYRTVLVVAFALAAVGCLLCAVAPSMPLLLIGRAFQGVAAGTLPVGVGLARNHAHPTRVRPTLGVIVAGEGVGVGIGFILGGLLENASWRLTFWVLLIPVALAVLLVGLFTPRGRPEGISRGIDVLGGVLFALGALGTLLALSEGGTWGWSSGKTLGCGLGGLVLLVAWVLWELRIENPLINVRFFGRPAFIWPAMSVFFYGAAIGALFLLFVGYAQMPKEIAGYGFSASLLHAGSFLLPNAAMVLLFGIVAGRVAQRIGGIPVTMFGGLVLAAVYFALAGAHTQEWQLYAGSFFTGVGSACALTGTITMVADAVDAKEGGQAQGTNSLVSAYGSSIGAAVVTALVTSKVISPKVPIPVESGYTHGFVVAGFAGVGIVAFAAVALTSRQRASGAAPETAAEQPASV